MKKMFAVLIFVLSFITFVSAQGEIQTRAQAIKEEVRLKKDPTDYALRSQLICFYQLKETAADKAALQRLRLDCV